MSDQGSLRLFRRNVYSQNGEDGVLDEIFRRLSKNSGWFCEFGAWDGRYGSNEGAQQATVDACDPPAAKQQRAG